MFEHLLRLGEVVAAYIPGQNQRSPWTLGHVSFWAGAREIKFTAAGAPQPEDRWACTHAVIAPQPSKTDAAGDKFEALICPFPSEADVLAASTDKICPFDTANQAWLFASGPLLWDLLTRDPVQRKWAGMVPLFRLGRSGPPALVAQITTNDFVRVFNLLGRRASPPVPVELQGKKLGGHCMRVAGCNHAAKMNATLVQIANKGRWSAFAFARQKGYDYFRTDLASLEALTTSMIVALACLPGAAAADDLRPTMPTGLGAIARQAGFGWGLITGAVGALVLVILMGWSTTSLPPGQTVEEDVPLLSDLSSEDDTGDDEQDPSFDEDTFDEGQEGLPSQLVAHMCESVDAAVLQACLTRTQRIAWAASLAALKAAHGARWDSGLVFADVSTPRDLFNRYPYVCLSYSRALIPGGWDI
jgi:hypothetical protein